VKLTPYRRELDANHARNRAPGERAVATLKPDDD